FAACSARRRKRWWSGCSQRAGSQRRRSKGRSGGGSPERGIPSACCPRSTAQTGISWRAFGSHADGASGGALPEHLPRRLRREGAPDPLTQPKDRALRRDLPAIQRVQIDASDMEDLVEHRLDTLLETLTKP